MKLAELNALFDKAEKENRFIEAFMVRSAYVESVITVLSTAILASLEGFDGKDVSLEKEMQKDSKAVKFFEKAKGKRLQEKINLLLELKGPAVVTSDSIHKLHTWRKQRREIMHNFAEKMLRAGLLEQDCKNAYEHLKKISSEGWFSRMEIALVMTQNTLP